MNDLQLKDEDSLVIAQVDGTTENVPQQYQING